LMADLDCFFMLTPTPGANDIFRLAFYSAPPFG